jgi:hypothetical protein
METEKAFTMAGHSLLFFDCSEVVGSGPEACSLSLDGLPIERWRFDPSPLEFQGAILVPVRNHKFWGWGYALAQIDPATRRLAVISKNRPYMRLLRLEGESVVYATTTYGGETDTIALT